MHRRITPLPGEFLRTLRAASILGILALALALGAQAQTLNVLYSLQGTSDGYYPFAGVAFDSAGNLYGTTTYGGTYNCSGNLGCGAVYEISPPASGSGSWTETVLHTFAGGRDGGNPYGSLVTDAAGNVYGTARYGGNISSASCKPWGCGVVFELSATGGGAWTETTLHAFSGGLDGNQPAGGLIRDSAGNLYGTAFAGGAVNAPNCAGGGCGVVFELSPGSSGWTETVLHAFQGLRDGALPFGSSLTFDNAGNLYGTTTAAGDYASCSCGSVFELSPVAGGPWKETTLRIFDGMDGNEPFGSLAFDSSGNLYGTTYMGGPPLDCDGGCGLTFELSPSSSGYWPEARPHVFAQNSAYNPSGSLVIDSAGDIYGVFQGGGPGNNGGIYRLSQVAGAWEVTELFTFEPHGINLPIGGLISDSSGNLYGTTASGGTHNAGAIFQYIP
jgi:uncharacterized repeat protein (TIGR03803 family)